MAHFHIQNQWFAPNQMDVKMMQFIPIGESGLHVQVSISKDPKSQLQVEQVEKYEMPEEVYDSLNDSVRAFKRRNKLGQFANVVEVEVDLSAFHLGARCCVRTEGLEKLGNIRFVGKLDGKTGGWIGVEYDEPVGKHNGLTIFHCRDKHGAFVRPDKIVIGDFEEEDYEI
jgi:tubulin-folding cofactor B